MKKATSWRRDPRWWTFSDWRHFQRVFYWNVLWTMKCLQNHMCSPRCELAVIAGPGENCWKRRGGEEIDRDRWGRAAKWKGEFDHGGKYLQSRWVNEKEEKTQVFARTKWSSSMKMRQWHLSKNFLPGPWSACFQVLPVKEGRGGRS